MWVLLEEGKSYRDVERELKISRSTVSRIVNQDPARLAALRDALSEERAQNWKQVENASIRTFRRLIERGEEIMFAEPEDDPDEELEEAGKTKKRKARELLSKEAGEWMKHAMRMAGVLRMSANDATNRAQLLSGSATARVEGAIQSEGIEELARDPDKLIRAAIELGNLDLLNPVPALRERAEQIMQEAT